MYRRLCEKIGWKPKTKGKYRKITGRMLLKWFNTQPINARVTEEIKEHLMGHKIKDTVHDTYLLANPEEFKKVYIKYCPI